MAKRDYDSAPVAETLGLERIILGLVSDLDDLRGGKISPNDAIARSMLAKQIFNGVRLYLTGRNYIKAQNAASSEIISLPTEAGQP